MLNEIRGLLTKTFFLPADDGVAVLVCLEPLLFDCKTNIFFINNEVPWVVFPKKHFFCANL